MPISSHNKSPVIFYMELNQFQLWAGKNRLSMERIQDLFIF